MERVRVEYGQRGHSTDVLFKYGHSTDICDVRADLQSSYLKYTLLTVATHLLSAVMHTLQQHSNN